MLDVFLGGPENIRCSLSLPVLFLCQIEFEIKFHLLLLVIIKCGKEKENE